MKNVKDEVNLFINDQESCLKNILPKTQEIVRIIDKLLVARDKGDKIYTMGNGGSASTASHFVSDLLKTSITEGDKRFFAVSLVDNIPVNFAWANDVSYKEIFKEQLKNFLTKTDILIGFSGSGKSSNVVEAMKYGKENGAICIGFTGMTGGDLLKVCDECFVVPSNDMLTIESIHVMLCHCMIAAIRNIGNPVFKYY